jgi:ABC-type molybdate transport system substrate-binding protein
MVPRLLLMAALCLVPIMGTAAAEELHVFGAGSLKEVMGELGER